VVSPCARALVQAFFGLPDRSVRPLAPFSRRVVVCYFTFTSGREASREIYRLSFSCAWSQGSANASDWLMADSTVLVWMEATVPCSCLTRGADESRE